MIAGMTYPTEAWAALAKRYGVKELLLVNIRPMLASLDTIKGAGYEKGVNKAIATLKAVGEVVGMFNNEAVVAQRVSKLSGSHQDRWHQNKTSTKSLNNRRTTGEKFLG